MGWLPKIGSARLLRDFQSLLEGGEYRLRNELSPTRDGHPLHFKQTAYNWLTFCVDQPPAFGPDGDHILQTEYGTVKFGNQNNRDLSMLLANGKLMFVWWAGVGDDFHLTQTVLKSAPVGPRQLTEEHQKFLLASLLDLERAMAENVVFKRNAGKNIGNYNLARCRWITDKADKVWLEALALSDLWEEIQLEYSLVVRTSFEEE